MRFWVTTMGLTALACALELLVLAYLGATSAVMFAGLAFVMGIVLSDNLYELLEAE